MGRPGDTAPTVPSLLCPQTGGIGAAGSTPHGTAIISVIMISIMIITFIIIKYHYHYYHYYCAVAGPPAISLHAAAAAAQRISDYVSLLSPTMLSSLLL